MTKPRTGDDRTHKLKIKPHAERIRAILDAMPVPGIAELNIAPGDWKPSARFISYEGDKKGRSYSVRQHHDKTYVFRLA